MGHRRPKRHHPTTKFHTLPSSPTQSSSTDFEFTISASHLKSSAGTASAADICPADELFYKGQLLPLHFSPRLSMVRTLLLSSASTSSSSDTTTTASRDSTASRSSAEDCLSSGRPSSVADDHEFKRLTNNPRPKPPSKYFSLPKIFFRKEQKNHTPPISGGGAGAKRVSSTAKEMIRKYMRKVKPLYEKLSQKQKIPSTSPPLKPPPSSIFRSANKTLCMAIGHKDHELNYPDQKNGHADAGTLHSFSGNLRLYPTRARSCISSCPSSTRSSPSHGKSGFSFSQTGRPRMYNPDASSMEELQNAIQGLIAHCKNSMLQNKTMVSNEV